MSKQTLNSQDVIGLLSKLKDSTPDYPADLLAARRAAFTQQAFSINIDGKGLSGKGGGDGGIGGTGGSGTLGGMTTAQTIMLQAVIGVWIIAAMLTAAYVFRDQIIDLLQDNGIVVEITQVPPGNPTIAVTSASTAIEIPTTELTLPPITEESGNSPVIEATPGSPTVGQNTPVPESDNQNPGLHLGQTPGTPDTPNQNKPEKPNKPEKEK